MKPKVFRLLSAIVLFVAALPAASQNNWAWISGSPTSLSVAPVHGTQGVATASNNPGSRRGSVNWTDNSGNLWLFGGYVIGYGYASDLWRYDISSNQWTWIKGPSTGNQAGLYGTMGVASSTTNPGGRYLAAGWTDNSGNLWLFGGAGRSASAYGYLNDTWRYNISTGQWTWISGSNAPNQVGAYGTLGTGSSTTTPGARHSHNTMKDNSGNLWLFGGYGWSAYNDTVGDLNDFWKFNLSSGVWTWVKGSDTLDQVGVYGTQGVGSSSNMLGSRRAGTTWTDNSGNLWLFGGYGFGTSTRGLLNDLWKYDVSSGNWSWIKGGSSPTQFGWYGTQGVAAVNNVPGGRYYNPVGVKDIAGNLWLFGGYAYSASSGGLLNDLWKYDISSNTWTWVRGAAIPNQNGVSGTQGVGSSTNTPGARYMHMTWGDNNGHYWVYGGFGTPATTSTPTVYGDLADMWRFDICLYPQEPVNMTSAQNLTVCSGGSATLSAVSGSNQIRWYAGINSTSAVATGTTFVTPALTAVNVSSVITYYAESYSCAASGSRTAVNVTVHPTPTLSVNSGTTCAGGVFVMFPGGAATYTFTGGSQVVFPTSSTSYTVSGTSIYGCPAASPVVSNVTVHPVPAISVNSGSVCSGSPFVLVPSGALTYTFSSGSATVSPVTNTFYTVMGTSSLGCMSQMPAVASVFVQASPNVAINSGAICAGQAFTLSPSGANAYTVSGGSYIVTPATSSSYTVWGSNSAACTASAVSTVTVNSVPVLTVNSGAICSGASFTISPSGASSYTISGGSAIVSPTANTSYSVTGTTNAGCIAAAAAISNVTVTPLPVISVNSGTLCMGSSYTLMPTGAQTYTYSSGSPVVSPTVNSIYFVTGTSAAGCVAASPAMAGVTVVPGSPISVNSGSVCPGGAFTLTPSGAATYSVSGGSFVVSPVNTSTYQVSGTNLSGCASTPVTATVTVESAPVVTVNSGAICAGGSFTLSPSGAVSYTYSSGSPVVSPSVNTIYTVTGSGTSGCISVPAVAQVTVHALPFISVNGGTLCAGKAFTMVPAGAVTYSYFPAGPVVSPSANSTYSVYGTSNQGCTSTLAAISSVSVVIPPVISVNSGSICDGSSFTLVPSGAASYTYSSGGAVVSPSATSSYTVFGGSSSGCISTPAIATVTVHTLPLISINSGTLCRGASFTLTPSGAISYSYSPAGPVVSPTSNIAYTVIGISNEGCVSAPAISNVTVHALPAISVNSGSICAGGSFTLVPSGAGTYTYSSGTAVVSPSANSTYSIWGTSSQGCTSQAPGIANVSVISIPVISVNSGSICDGSSFTFVPSGAASYTYSSGGAVVSPSATSNYTVIGGSSSGCISTPALATVTVHALPLVSINSGTICRGSSFSLTPSGAVSYSYSPAGPVVSPTSNIAYTITGISNEGCVSAPAISNVTVHGLPVVSVNSGSICAGGSFTLVPSGAGTYTYSSGTAVVSPSANSTYSVWGTSSQGCTSQAPGIANVSVISIPVISVNSGSICDGSSFTFVPSGAASYTYSSGGAVVSPSATSNYTVIGGSSSGCVSTPAIATVTVYALPLLSINSGTICRGSSFTLTPSGAVSYSYSPAGPVVSPTSNIAYTVIGISNEGCVSAPAISNVTVHGLPVVSVNSGSICAGGSFTMLPSGAGSYTYSSGTAVVSPSANSTYSVWGTSSQGCPSQAPGIANVNVISIPVISVNSGTICNGASFTLIPSGAASYTFSGGSPVVAPAVTSTYAVSGTGASGCPAAMAAIATVAVNNTFVIGVNSGSVCAGQSFTFAPTGAITYTYSGGSAVVSPQSTTSYTLTGTGSGGCLSQPAIATVSVQPLPLVTVNSGTLCAGSSFTLTPAGAISYSYSPAGPVISPTINTQYTVTGTDAAGCVSPPVYSSLTVHGIPVISVNSGGICPGGSFTIVPAGAGSYTFSSGTAVVSPTTASAYTVTGTSAQGCVSQAPAIANVTLHPVPVVSVAGGSVCAGATFTLSPVGAVNYSYAPAGPAVSPSVTTSYSISGTNSLGCVSAVNIATVTVSPLPSVAVSGGSICSGDSFTLNPTGAVNYTFSSGQVVTPSVSTSYTTTGVDAQGCVSVPVVTQVTVHALPSVVVNGGTVCSGSPFVLSPSGASSYTFSPGGPVVSPTITTSYSVTGTSVEGCISQGQSIATVSVIALPVITVSSGTICPGGTFTISPAGALSYTYSSGSPLVSPAVTTSYTITGTGPGGCIAAAAAVATVQVQNAISITIGNGTICTGESFTLAPSGANSFTFSSGSAVVSPTVSATYSVWGSSAGCVAPAPGVATVTVLYPPVVTVSGGTICAGESFSLMPSGAVSYSFSSGSPVVTPSANAVYTVTGTDSTGCISLPAAPAVVVNQLPVMSLAGGSVCAGGSFTLSPSGAVSYTFSSGTSVVLPANTATFSAIGSDTNGCISSPVIAEVTVHPLPQIQVSASPPLVCKGDSTLLSVSGALSYTFTAGNFSVVPASGNISVMPDSNTVYQVAGESAYGCVNTRTLLVQVDACTGVTQSRIAGFRIHPNPTTGAFYVNTDQPALLTLLNDLGQVVMQKQLDAGRNTIEGELLTRGIYFVVITSGDSVEKAKLIRH
jgi:hypothetical protein